jgi:hypothetical protein
MEQNEDRLSGLEVLLKYTDGDLKKKTEVLVEYARSLGHQ